ncbi:MAG: aldo/keto reductase [Candidatus Sumerlaeota bacterium]|nr:aldo/keto reductase [Candidatus Sumerlaeota bacterium]
MSANASKIALGTVQLGMQYGIANKIGKPRKENAFAILKAALDHGVTHIDTARAYGDSEAVIGEFLKMDGRDARIVTKLPELGEALTKAAVLEHFEESLRQLGRKSVYCYMVHAASDAIRDRQGILKEVFGDLKARGLIEKAGLSVYEEAEIWAARERFQFDLLQAPVSVFDQRLIQSKALERLKGQGIEIHARSIFLQGLVFLTPSQYPRKLKEMAPYRIKLEVAAFRMNMTAREIALLFVAGLPFMDKVVLGAESASQVLENAITMEQLPVFTRMSSPGSFADLAVNDPMLINPGEWS